MSVRIGIHLPCRSCRHDLKGVAAWERCPECGTPIMTTLVECTDAGVRGLLRLRHPWAVAIGLSLCCVAITLWWTCLSGPAGAARALTFVAEGAPQTPRMATLAAAITGVLGLLLASIGAWLLSPRRDGVLAREYGTAVPRALWCLPAWAAIDGVRIAGELSIFTPPLVGRGWSIACLAVEAGLACMVTLGLRRAFAVLGRRSRTYREAHLARQDLDLLARGGDGVEERVDDEHDGDADEDGLAHGHTVANGPSDSAVARVLTTLESCRRSGPTRSPASDSSPPRTRSSPESASGSACWSSA